MNVLAIDPGVKACACAWFFKDVLREVYFDATPQGGPGAFEAVIVERPDYQGDRSNRARTQDLIDLAWAGALAAAYAAESSQARLVEYTPRQWKGSEPKPVHHWRLWSVLSVAEKILLGGAPTEYAIDRARTKGAADRWGKPGVAYYPRSFTTHNLLDAAALGCFHLGRLEKR